MEAKTYTFYLSVELSEKLDTLADDENRSRSNMLAELIERAFSKRATPTQPTHQEQPA